MQKRLKRAVLWFYVARGIALTFAFIAGLDFLSRLLADNRHFGTLDGIYGLVIVVGGVCIAAVCSIGVLLVQWYADWLSQQAPVAEPADPRRRR